MERPTKVQRDIARKLGVRIRNDSRDVAAARIYDAVEQAIHPGVAPREPTEKQIKYATDLGVYRIGDSLRVCGARIDEELRRRNLLAIRRMRLKPGDTVEKRYVWRIGDETYERLTMHVVSSIGEDLRVYFKNPVSESGGWPSQLRKIRRTTSEGRSGRSARD